MMLKLTVEPMSKIIIIIHGALQDRYSVLYSLFDAAPAVKSSAAALERGH